ncbi:winged helix DNA-binding domain-containing protein [Rubrivirga sp.]|uniref:winged helix DNA-binding domain-containing protein n=1 Tax=Rubrivirga sp. TaxID=1885344 RepID=UPI003B517129
MNLAARRLRNQRLVGTRLLGPEAVVGWLGAVQAQDYPGAAWAVAQRTTGATAADVDAALDAGTILRTHVLRPTWHLVRPADLRWMQALTGPRVKRSLRSYDRKLEIDDRTVGRSQRLIADALADGAHRTRAELAEVLEGGGIVARGPRLAHLVMHAEADALVCSGRRRGRTQTYALVDERAPGGPVLEPEEALVELVRRYLRSHGPATPHDVAWWSGLTVTDARRGLAALGDEGEEVEIDGTAYWQVAPVAPVSLPDPTVHLLPNYDEHVVAYRDHGPSVDPATPDALAGWGNGSTTHQIVRNGLVVGGWRRTLHRDRVEVRVTLQTPFSAAERAALVESAEAFGRFLGRPVGLDVDHRRVV